MKNLIVTLVAGLAIGASAQAAQWTKLLSCESSAGTLVVDRAANNPDALQVVITGSNAVNAISYGIQGNSSVQPPNFHFYEGGNKLVISGLTATANFNPTNPDEYQLYVAEGASNSAALKYWSNTGNEREDYRFYNCVRN
ncbi:MAG: hypothetical protein ACXVB9_14220 [Bdellovibrionota bacterium]